MKKIILLLLLITSTGCLDKYLDEPSLSNTGGLSEVDAYSTLDGVKAAMGGLLRFQRGQWDEFRTTDAGGIYSIGFSRTVKGNDIIIQSGWYNFDYQNDNREPVYRKTIFSWGFPYAIIAKINQYIEGLEKADKIGETDKNMYIAQAKALRGFYYFQLALEFNHAYKRDVNAPAPPVYTTINIEGKPMGTLTELYNQIISDLEFSVENGPINRVDNSWINNRVAAGILANVYLSMEEWEKAESLAKIAYGGDISLALNSVSDYKPMGFNSKEDKEWLWSLPQRADQSNYYYLAPHVFMDNINDTYRNGYVNVNFVESFEDNDRRKEAFLNRFTNLPKTDSRYYITRKFQFSFSSDAPLLRTAEMALIAAESAYRQGKITEANQMLNEFKNARYTNYEYIQLAGNDIVDQILIERRKELYGEFGVEWFDAKRLQKGIKRTGNHRVLLELEPNDRRFILKIPQVEIDNNPHINADVNINR